MAARRCYADARAMGWRPDEFSGVRRRRVSRPSPGDGGGTTSGSVGGISGSGAGSGTTSGSGGIVGSCPGMVVGGEGVGGMGTCRRATPGPRSRGGNKAVWVMAGFPLAGMRGLRRKPHSRPIEPVVPPGVRPLDRGLIAVPKRYCSQLVEDSVAGGCRCRRIDLTESRSDSPISLQNRSAKLSIFSWTMRYSWLASLLGQGILASVATLSA